MQEQALPQDSVLSEEEKVEYSENLNSIRQMICNKKYSRDALELFLGEVFESNSDSDAFNPQLQVMSKKTFLNLLGSTPIFISEKIYNSLKYDYRFTSALTKQEFINSISDLKFSSMDVCCDIVYRFIDYNQDNIMELDDLIHLMYITSSTMSSSKLLGVNEDRIKLFIKLLPRRDKVKLINKRGFTKLIQHQKKHINEGLIRDVFLLFFTYIFQILPFFRDSLKVQTLKIKRSLYLCRKENKAMFDSSSDSPSPDNSTRGATCFYCSLTNNYKQESFVVDTAAHSDNSNSKDLNPLRMQELNPIRDERCLICKCSLKSAETEIEESRDREVKPQSKLQTDQFSTNGRRIESLR